LEKHENAAPFRNIKTFMHIVRKQTQERASAVYRASSSQAGGVVSQPSQFNIEVGEPLRRPARAQTRLFLGTLTSSLHLTATKQEPLTRLRILTIMLGRARRFYIRHRHQWDWQDVIGTIAGFVLLGIIVLNVLGLTPR
jgi:hypothetical protein